MNCTISIVYDCLGVIIIDELIYTLFNSYYPDMGEWTKDLALVARHHKLFIMGHAGHNCCIQAGHPVLHFEGVTFQVMWLQMRHPLHLYVRVVA